MKYFRTTANGDAGEFFAAYKIANELGWPCRLFDIDIGIDAQVEVLTTDGESTGRFVALQVKATSSDEVDCRYVSDQQLKYWRSLEIPVFVVLVDLEKEEMFLHLIKERGSYHKTKMGSRKIPFNRKKDKFGPASAAVLAKASEQRVMEHIRTYLNDVDAAVTTMLEHEADFDDSPDPYAFIEDMESRSELFGLLSQAKAVSLLGKVGSSAIAECRQRLSWALSDLQGIMEHMKSDYADKADIASFLEEDYESRPDSDL